VKRKVVFDQGGETVLGHIAVRIIAIDYLIRRYGLDAIVIPGTTDLWQRAFPGRTCRRDEIPESHRLAPIAATTPLNHHFGLAGFDIFEMICWEFGFFDTRKLWIDPPRLFPCATSGNAIMIYPEENTEANRVYTAAWWSRVVSYLLQRGNRVNFLGTGGYSHLAEFYRAIESLPVRRFPATIAGLADCVAASTIAMGGSTGPSWVCLMSNIRQVALESKGLNNGCWEFERVQRVLAKRLTILTDLSAVFGRDAGRTPCDALPGVSLAPQAVSQEPIAPITRRKSRRGWSSGVPRGL
jgi:hypothetical protein